VGVFTLAFLVAAWYSNVVYRFYKYVGDKEAFNAQAGQPMLAI
jgi:hypothetical protein